MTLYVIVFIVIFLTSMITTSPIPSENDAISSVPFDVLTYNLLPKNDSNTYWNFESFQTRFHVVAEEMSEEEWRQMIVEHLKQDEMIGSILQEIPWHIINIDYGDHVCVHLGNQLNPTQTQLQPIQLSFPLNGSNGLYTLVAIDPDVPSRNNSKYSEFLHWLVVNIPDDNIDQGNTLAEYLGPLPSQGMGFHRFIFLIYQQMQYIDTSLLPYANVCDLAQRARFNVQKFAQLHELGQPTAINYFTTEFDPVVPKVIEKCLHDQQL